MNGDITSQTSAIATATTTTTASTTSKYQLHASYCYVVQFALPGFTLILVDSFNININILYITFI